MTVRPKEAELFHTERRTDIHDKTNCRFPQFVNEPKTVLQ